MAGKQKPNLGNYDDPPDWEEVLKYFRGSELQNYFTKVLEDNLVAKTKPQYVDQIPRAIKDKDRTVGAILKSRCQQSDERYDEILETLELKGVYERSIDLLSGGELQRFAIAAVCVTKADVYMFDEPSSFLDVKQRLAAGRLIRSLAKPETYVIGKHTCVGPTLRSNDSSHRARFVCVGLSVRLHLPALWETRRVWCRDPPIVGSRGHQPVP